MTAIIITAIISFSVGFLSAAFIIGGRMRNEAYDKAVEEHFKDKSNEST